MSITNTSNPRWYVQDDCPICLSNFEDGDRVRVLPCGHIFHQDEIDDWLTGTRRLCPTCKQDILIRWCRWLCKFTSGPVRSQPSLRPGTQQAFRSLLKMITCIVRRIAPPCRAFSTSTNVWKNFPNMPKGIIRSGKSSLGVRYGSLTMSAGESSACPWKIVHRWQMGQCIEWSDTTCLQ